MAPNPFTATINFFRGYAIASGNRLRKDFAAGKISPLFKFMGVVSFTGYAMQYTIVWSE